MFKFLVLFSIAQLALADFDDTLSRSKFFPIASAAYNDNPIECIKNNFGSDVEITTTYTVQCDPIDKCFTYVALSHTDKAILIGFRGSMSTAQLIAEGLDSMLKPHVQAFGSTQVSEYFFNAFNLTWSYGLKEEIGQLSTKYWDYEIWLSGHSLGGALASLTATAISYDYPITEDRIKLYTYGQPRIGDFAYALTHDIIVPNSYRVTHSKDIVVNLPPIIFLFFYHHKTEVFYDNEMSKGASFQICKEDEDFSCSIKKFGTSIDDHTHYYGVSVSDFGGSNCAQKLV